MNFKVGDKIAWKWMGREIEGKVIEIHKEPIVKKIKDKLIKRNGSPERPAYYVQSSAGNFALKLASEVYAIECKDC